MDDRRLLTPRQRQVLALYASDASLSQIAVELGISRDTVRSHRRDIAAVLDVHSVTRAVVVALARGEIVLDGEVVGPVAPVLLAA